MHGTPALEGLEAEYLDLAQAGDVAAIDCWVRAVILRLLEVAGPGPNPLVTAMWATGLHRAVIGPPSKQRNDVARGPAV